MPVGMQETNFARSSSHILPTVLGPRQMTTYQRVMKYGTSAAIKDGPAPVGAFVLGWSAFCPALACRMNYVDGPPHFPFPASCWSHLLHFGFLTDC